MTVMMLVITMMMMMMMLNQSSFTRSKLKVSQLTNLHGCSFLKRKGTHYEIAPIETRRPIKVGYHDALQALQSVPLVAVSFVSQHESSRVFVYFFCTRRRSLRKETVAAPFERSVLKF